MAFLMPAICYLYIVLSLQRVAVARPSLSNSNINTLGAPKPFFQAPWGRFSLVRCYRLLEHRVRS